MIVAHCIVIGGLSHRERATAGEALQAGITEPVRVLGGIAEDLVKMFVGFDNPGGLQPGAPVKIAGVKVGAVKEILFRGSRTDGMTLVQARVSIEERHKEYIHNNAIFYITSDGLLAEQYVAIDPGSPDRPPLEEGAVVRGIDAQPPGNPLAPNLTTTPPAGAEPP